MDFKRNCGIDGNQIQIQSIEIYEISSKKLAYPFCTERPLPDA